jgi:hypothetical protein
LAASVASLAVQRLQRSRWRSVSARKSCAAAVVELGVLGARLAPAMPASQRWPPMRSTAVAKLSLNVVSSAA